MRWLIFLSALTVGCSDETISGFADREGVYRLIELNGAPFPAQATISFPEPGIATGEGPCNAWSAAQTVPYPWIELGPIAATRRACADLEAESAFFAALSQATLAEVQGPVLILSNDEGLEMVFTTE